MVSIKTNFLLPSADNPEKQGQRLAQDLSSNFKAIKKSLTTLEQASSSSVTPAVGPYGLDGVEFSDSFLIVLPTSGQASQTYVFTHNFGANPTGFWVTDLTWNFSNSTPPVLYRTTWTSTQITLKITITDLSAIPGNTAFGTFKVLVLR